MNKSVTYTRIGCAESGATATKSVSAKLIAAFLAVYCFWGSAFLSIRFGLESFPPFLLAGLRFQRWPRSIMGDNHD